MLACILRRLIMCITVSNNVMVIACMSRAWGEGEQYTDLCRRRHCPDMADTQAGLSRLLPPIAQGTPSQ